MSATTPTTRRYNVIKNRQAILRGPLGSENLLRPLRYVESGRNSLEDEKWGFRIPFTSLLQITVPGTLCETICSYGINDSVDPKDGMIPFVIILRLSHYLLSFLSTSLRGDKVITNRISVSSINPNKDIFLSVLLRLQWLFGIVKKRETISPSEKLEIHGVMVDFLPIFCAQTIIELVLVIILLL